MQENLFHLEVRPPFVQEHPWLSPLALMTVTVLTKVLRVLNQSWTDPRARSHCQKDPALMPALSVAMAVAEVDRILHCSP